MAGKWRVFVDRGGTFTDVVGVSPCGGLHIGKTPSADGAELRVIRRWLGLADGAVIPAAKVAEIRIGSTVCTNALLERKGAKTAVAVTAGFADALVIGDQTRPALFDLLARRPPPLWARAVEINERTGADGKSIRPQNFADCQKQCARQFAELRKSGIQAIAIALMHSGKYPRRERQLAAIAKKAGFPTVVASSDSAALTKFIPRAHTAAADAYLSAVLAGYAGSLRRQCQRGVRLLFMHSGGDLNDIGKTRAIHAVLSGPAGGLAGMREQARVAGFRRAVGLDMGGTSADVALADAGAPPPLRWENTIAGVPLFAPMPAIHTVAAGGGSIVRIVGGRLLAGPRSAGAMPGPACYGRGGPLTVSDCNVVLGKIRAAHLPNVFGRDNRAPLDEGAARKQFAALAKKNKTAPEQLARGFIRVAVSKMADAIRQIAAAGGEDIRKRALVGFGGACGQHLCLVADALGITKALAPRNACVLSAWGIGTAGVGIVKREVLECPPDDPQLAGVFARLQKRALVGLPPHDAACRVVRMILRCRYRGVENTLAVPWHRQTKNIAAMFARRHKKRYGWALGFADITAAAAEVRITINAPPPPPQAAAKSGRLEDAKCGEYIVHFDDGAHRAIFYDWRKLPSGAVLSAPAVVVDEWNTIVIEPGWRARVCKDGALKLDKTGEAAKADNAQPAAKEKERKREKEREKAKAKKADAAAMLEIFNNRFTAVASEMGEALRQTATSVNIRERLDFSCAIFDGGGNLVANAPHIPVHLGSMSESVRFVLRRGGVMRAGDVFMLNSPYSGGTHLPDITVIRPLWLRGAKARGGKPHLMLAARGHHADIGGISPASMPADSRHINEEGILLPLTKLADGGKLRMAKVRKILASGDYPARNINQNIADLRAQVAALAAGALAMDECAAVFGAAETLRHLQLVQDNAAAITAELLPKLREGNGMAMLDDGSAIRVKVRREKGRAVFDFGGTAGRHGGNFNAPMAVARAAVIYCLRTLLGGDIPLNDGIMRRVKLIIPRRSMLRAAYPSAVAAGNVESSQNIVDAVFAALGVCAGAQGTCNNLTAGFDGKQYYETICGGGAAVGDGFFGRGAAGGDAMQTNMTNSRATDPEVLETTLPVRLEEFSIRRGSGGGGKYRGGWGAVRRLVFLARGEVAILSSHRKVPPRGINGGGDGKPGVNRIKRAGKDGKKGKTETLPACASATMQPGDTFIVKTPGGGGCG